jgi:antitoxin ParD1/3/4
MGTIQKTIMLTETQDEWIKEQLSAGNFASESECIGDLINREQDRSPEIEAIRAAIIEGELSGEPIPFDVQEFKLRMKKKHG